MDWYELPEIVHVTCQFFSFLNIENLALELELDTILLQLFTCRWAEQGSSRYGSVYPDIPAPSSGHNNNIYQERLEISFIFTSDPGSTVTVRMNE